MQKEISGEEEVEELKGFFLFLFSRCSFVVCHHEAYYVQHELNSLLETSEISWKQVHRVLRRV